MLVYIWETFILIQVSELNAVVYYSWFVVVLYFFIFAYTHIYNYIYSNYFLELLDPGVSHVSLQSNHIKARAQAPVQSWQSWQPGAAENLPTKSLAEVVSTVGIVVGGLEHSLLSPILGVMIQSDFHIFQRGWNHQPGIPWQLRSGFSPPKASVPESFLFHIMMKLWIGNSPRWRGCKVGLKDDGPWAPWDPSRVTTGSQTLGSCCSKWIVFFQVFNEVVRNYLYFSFTGMNRQYWHSDSIAGWLILLTHTRVLWLLLCFVFRVDSFTGTHVVQLITTARQFKHVQFQLARSLGSRQKQTHIEKWSSPKVN